MSRGKKLMRKLLPLLAAVTASAVAVGGLNIVSATETSDAQKLCTDKFLLARGAAEVITGADGNIVVKDNTNVYGGPTDRALSDVAFGITSAALQTRGENQADAAFDFLGPVGSEHFTLPGGDNLTISWPKSELNIEPVSVPEGGGFGAYDSTNNTVLVNSTTQDYQLEPAQGQVQWAFSKPGVYTFKVAEGKELNFVVGDGHLTQCEPVAQQPPNSDIELTAKKSKSTTTTSKKQQYVIVNSQKVPVPHPEDEISNMFGLFIKVLATTFGKIFENFIPILTQFANAGWFK